MSINFKYIDYGVKFSGIYSDEKSRSKDNLYIFLDNRMKDIFSKRFYGELFNETPTLLTMEEFKERIFYTDKILLKEAKRILAFFKCIPEEIKEDLGITTYYDVIDFANNFFAYYREMNLSKIEDIEESLHWQKKYLDYFSKIKISFDKMCEEYNYLPSDWVEIEENYSDIWIRNFSSIIFIDIVEFPKLYVDIIKKLSMEKNIEITLQMSKGDFNEENFKIKKVKIPEKIKEIEIYKYKNELEEALSLIYLKKNKNCEIYSPVPEKNSFYKILPSYFAPSQNFTMNDTKLYKFLNIQLELLNSQEESLGKTYQLSQFLSAFEEKVFKDYYEITEEEFNYLNYCAIEGYKYISREILKDEWIVKNLPLELIEKLNRIIFELENIALISNTDELYQFFKKDINMELFIEDKLDNKDIFDKFFEIFGTIKSNEIMKIHKSFKEYFGNKIGMSLYRLLIQYMKDLAIKNNLKYGQEIGIVKPIDFVRYSDEHKDINYFLDITDEFLPKNIGDGLIFTEKQRKKLGIFTKEDRRDIERYRFFQAVFSDKNSIIFTRKDEEKSIDISPFLEEIILKYSLEVRESPILSKSIVNILKDSLKGNSIGYETSENEIFQKSIEDFEDNKLKLGAYDYLNLIECPLKFYFSTIERLTHIVKYEDKDINDRILGIIVHKVLEEFVNSIWKKILQDGLVEIDYNEIYERMKKAFKKERAKIPVHMDNYCEEIMIPLISKNIVKFFRDLKNNYEGIKITRFQSEKSSYEKSPFYSSDIDVYLKGRADLVIESQLGNEIIDYKTGNKKDKQLDYYTIILYGESGQAKKLVFNAWKGRIEREDKVILTREKLEEDVKNFVEASEYTRVEKKSICASCEYYNVCRGDNK